MGCQPDRMPGHVCVTKKLTGLPLRFKPRLPACLAIKPIANAHQAGKILPGFCSVPASQCARRPLRRTTPFQKRLNYCKWFICISLNINVLKFCTRIGQLIPAIFRQAVAANCRGMAESDLFFAFWLVICYAGKYWIKRCMHRNSRGQIRLIFHLAHHFAGNTEP